MFAFFQQLFDTSDFRARWTCGNWSPEHGWLHILSDLAIFGAYAAIPLALAYFIRRRQDVPFIPIFWLFAVFIFSCGFGHLVEASLFWHPWYRFSGGVKLVTAVVSWLTVLSLVKVLPSALALPGLAKVNRQLEAEMAERERAEDQLEASLHEKEVLLKEIHHRVKNNLQVISSILQMQSRAIDNPQYRAIFGECHDRVRTMALVHEKLYRSPSLASIDLGEQVRELAAMLATSYGRPGVRLTVEVEATPVNIENAVPLGLVLNELVSNALKHAFPENRDGTVTVTLARPTPEQSRLSVRDDGRGLPEGFTWDKAKSLGLTMVGALARQLRAIVEVRQEGGTEIVLTFPAPALAHSERKA